MKKYNFNRKYTLKEVDEDLYGLIQSVLLGLEALAVFFGILAACAIIGIIGCILTNTPLLGKYIALYSLIGVSAIAVLFALIAIFVDVIHVSRMRNLPTTTEELDAAGINTPEEFINMLYWHAGKRIPHRFCEKQAVEITICFCNLIKNRSSFVGEQAEEFFECYKDILEKWNLSPILQVTAKRSTRGMEGAMILTTNEIRLVYKDKPQTVLLKVLKQGD